MLSLAMFDDDFNKPLTDFEQGQLFVWLRESLTEHQEDEFRTRFPVIAGKILPLRATHGLPNPLFKRLVDLVQARQKIVAIKELRAATGWGLKESKDFIDRYIPEQ